MSQDPSCCSSSPSSSPFMGIQYDPKCSLGNILTIVTMLLSVGIIYGTQQVLNKQMQSDILAIQVGAQTSMIAVGDLREATTVLKTDVGYIKETVKDIRDDQRSAPKPK